MYSETIIQLDIYLIISLIISLLSTAFGIFCLVLRNKRLKNANVVCSKGTFWIPCIFLVGNPIILILAHFYDDPYTYFSANFIISITSAIYITIFWINGNITFHDNGFISTNMIFMKKFYSYSDVVDSRIVTRKIVTRNKYGRHTRYVDYAEIFVKQENTAQCKKLSIEVKSYNFNEFMRMLDMKCPQLRNGQEFYVGNGNYVKFYDRYQ